MSTFEKRLDALEKYPAAVRQAVAEAGEKLVDVLGVVHSNQSQIRTIKKSAAVELETGEAGERWQVEVPDQIVRSYNTPGLLAALLQDWKGDLLSLVLYLVEKDVLRIEWQWSKLKREIENHDVAVTIVGHEIQDGDPSAQIGQFRRPGYPKYTPVEEKEDASTDGA